MAEPRESPSVPEPAEEQDPDAPDPGLLSTFEEADRPDPGLVSWNERAETDPREIAEAWRDVEAEQGSNHSAR